MDEVLTCLRTARAELGAQVVPQLVCDYVVDRQLADAVAVSLMGRHESRGLLGVRGSLAVDLDELQFTLGEGPCFDAFETGRPILEPDLRQCGATRWPVFAPAALSADVRSVFAFPLQVGTICIGVIEIATSSAGALTDQAVTSLMSIAELTAESVLDAQPLLGGEGLLDYAELRLRVHQATGMVAVQTAGSMEASLALLRAHAFAEDRSLYDVTDDVLSRQLIFAGR